jgi:DnaJ like chaperone protein
MKRTGGVPNRKTGRIVLPMSIWGKIVGAAAGLAMGGPIGALVGAVTGHFTLDRGSDALTGVDPEAEVAFTVGVIALGAKMAKADGVVTKDEIDAFKEVFIIPPEEMKNVARVFNLAKRDIAGYEEYANQMAELFGAKPQVLEDVLDGLFHIAKADNVVHESELEFLRSVGNIFGLDELGFERIRARHVELAKSDPFMILGLERTATNEEIRRTYRNLVRENHPDKLMARGVPEEAIEIANRKLATINAAYDQVAKERDL